MLLSWYSYFRLCFRHIQTYSSIIQEDTNVYSEPCVSLAYSEPCHILITRHFQIPRYIHNIILNISQKLDLGRYISRWTLHMLVHHPRKHATHVTRASTSSTLFLKLWEEKSRGWKCELNT